MLKKYIIFGSVVLLVAALFTLTGCSQATDSDGGTLSYSENHLFGNADARAVALAVASAKATGRSVVLTEAVNLVGGALGAGLPSVADFEDVPVRVEGNATVSGNIIVNAAFANLTFMDGSSITVERGGAFIYQGNDNFIMTDSGNSGFKVKYVTDPLTGTQGTDLHVAVKEYTIGAGYNDIAAHITNFYVLEKLTIDTGSIAAPGPGNAGRPIPPRVIALGEVDLAADNSLVFADLTNFQFTTSAVLTSKVAGVTLTLPGAARLPTIEAAVPMNIAGPSAGGGIPLLTIDEIRGPDTLTISDSSATGITALTITDVTDTGKVTISTGNLGGAGITTNAGSINFALGASGLNGALNVGNPLTREGNTGAITIGVTTLDAPVNVLTVNSGTINIDAGTVSSPIAIARNTGAVNFRQPVIFDTAPYILRVPANDGDINFYNTLSLLTPLGNGGSTVAEFAQNIKGSGTVTFGDAVSIGANTAILNIDCKTVFNAGIGSGAFTPTLAFGGDVTLANGQAIALGSTLTLKPGKRLLVGDIPVLAAGLNAPGAVITPAGATTLTAGRARTADDDEEFVEDRALTLGTAAISGIAGDLRIVGGGILRTAAAGTISLGAGGGTLTLEEGAVLAVAGTVTLGDTTIAVGTAGTDGYSHLTASGGAVTLGANRISGSGSTLLIPEDAGSPVIGVPDGVTLSLAGVNLDLLTAGSLTLTYAANNTTLRLEAGTNPGKITLGEDTGYTITSFSGRTLTADTVAALTGSGILRGDTDAFPVNVGDLSGSASGVVTITKTAAGLVTLSNAGASVN